MTNAATRGSIVPSSHPHPSGVAFAGATGETRLDTDRRHEGPTTMLDEGPRDQPPKPSQPDALDHDPHEAPLESTAPGTTGATGALASPAVTPSAGASATALIRADMTDAWSRLDRAAQLMVGASIAAIVIVIIGLPLSVWDSAPFALLVLVASTITAVTAWFGASAAFRELPIPRQTIELVATHVVAVLAVLKAIEIVFDLDTEGIVGVLIGGALVAAAVVQLIAAQRRGADPIAFTRGDQGTKIAAVGLLLVLIGWAFNLSISFWTMGQAALPLAVLTIAALTVAEAPRIQSPVPVAWIGSGIAVFGAILALANWGDLTSLGRTEIVLDAGDFLGLIAYSVGAALIVAGGVISGRAEWVASHPAGPGPVVEA
jgi:hypothetical protein